MKGFHAISAVAGVLVVLLSCTGCREQQNGAARPSHPAPRAAAPMIFHPADYRWHDHYDAAQSLDNRVSPPEGYERISAEAGSFAAWLRGLPLKPGRPAVCLFDGREKENQQAHHAVFDIDTGAKDLQQCADAVMRLRAEYLLAMGKTGDIHFNFTSGDRADYARWAEGYRPAIRGNRVRWTRSASRDTSYAAFRAYLDAVFMYAGTASLSRELHPVAEEEMRIGDVFIHGGFPGHAVLVVDMAAHQRTGHVVFLLAQSYMPAQDIHLLRNPAEPDISPWYSRDFGESLATPEWTFPRGELRRW